MDHTVRAYEAELEDLSHEVDALGRMAVAQLRAALDVVVGDGGTPAEEIMAADKALNAAAQEIERKAIRLIALRQPMADDLRRTVVALKAALELERCGDLAKNTAKRSLRIEPPAPPALLQSLKELGALAVDALERVLRALSVRDIEAARVVWREDDAIDALHADLVRRLLEGMTQQPHLTTAGAQLLFIAKNLERIGDHATNLAELACYEATGSSQV